MNGACRSRPGRLLGLLVGLLAATTACEPEGPYDPEDPYVEGVLGEWRAGLTVDQAGGCSTAIVRGLARQLIDEINCLRPGTLTPVDPDRLNEREPVFAFLQRAATDDLHRAIDARGQSLDVNSMLRTLPQQFLLFRWYEAGQCGITLAARPGRSPHESGLALDTSSYDAWRNALAGQDWEWHGAGDLVHFDYRGGGTVALAGLSVQAFQRLWNRNHPEELLAVDGDFGPQTEARLRRSPTDGFDIGGCEPEPPPPPPVPDRPTAPPPPDMAEPDVAGPDGADPDWRALTDGPVFDAAPDFEPTTFDAALDAWMDLPIDPTALDLARVDPGAGLGSISGVSHSGGCQSSKGSPPLRLLASLGLIGLLRAASRGIRGRSLG